MTDDASPLVVSPSVATALKHAPLGIAIFDRDMRYLAASHQFLTDQDLPADTPLIGRRHYEVFPEIPQVWRDLHARVLAEGIELRSGEGDRFVDRNGKVHWIRWSMAPWRTDDGQVAGLVLYTEVVTEAVEARRQLQAAEARYRAVFSQAAIGVARVAAEGRFLEMNDQFCAIVRRSRETLQAGQFRDLVPDAVRQDTVATARALLSGERDSFVAEREIFAGDTGEPIWVHLTVSPIQTGDDPAYLLILISDIGDRKAAEDEQRHYQGQQRLLINELNHRVKNTLATVQSMAAQTLKTEPDPLIAFEKFEARLLGLSRVHDVLTQESWHGADLRAVADRALAPFAEVASRIALDGPSVWLAPGGALTMALIFHELATNALKYGALSCDTGRVALGWTYDPGRRLLQLHWRETGGPAVLPPTRRGFGSRLIERSLRGELQGSATMDYRPEGLACAMIATLSDPAGPATGTRPQP
jgi:PAS domain S-box-containing protein